MKQVQRILFSTRTMTILLLVYGISMMVATFIESSFDTSTAKVLIYNSIWFEILMLWLILIFTTNIKTYRLTSREKWPILIFHLAFIFMFIGGAITRYSSFEGQMPIKEGQTTNEIISDLTYFNLSVTDGDKTLNYNKHPYTMSYFNSKDTKWPLKRTYKQNFLFENKVITLKSLDYIPLAKDSVEVTELGKKMLNIVTIGQTGRVNNYISEGGTKSINGMIFSFNNPIEGSVQLTERNNNLYIELPVEGQFMSMLGQQKGVVTDSLLLARQSGTIKADESTMLNHRALYSVNGVNFIIPNSIFKGKRVYYKGDKTEPLDKNLLDVVQIELESGNIKDTLFIKGGKGVTGYSETTQINGLHVSIGFGSKILYTDFSIRCDDFILDRYPGSNNPSSYESKITIIDSDKENQHHIYMNNVVDYKGYRFFQASYFPDESGTILSVNADRWGTNVTYFGYFLLFTGMFFTLFWKNTHFWKLNHSLKKMRTKNYILLFMLFFGLGATSYAQNDIFQPEDSLTLQHQKIGPNTQFAKPNELGSKRIINLDHAKKFGQLLVQDFQGRVKPMDTYTLELLRKIHKKDIYKKGDNNITPLQWFISMQIDPGYWANEPLIKVSKKGGDQLMKETGANADGYTSYTNLVDLNTGIFKLENQNKNSFSKRKAEQSNYDKAVIELTERFNIFSNIAFGYYTNMIPVKNDPSQTWVSWIYSTEESPVEIDETAYRFLTPYFNGVKEGLKTNNWTNADKSINEISELQKTWGKDIIPSDLKIKLEILYNHLNAFFWLMIVYSFLGMALIIIGFLGVLSSSPKYHHFIRFSTKILLGLMVLALTIQALALAVRWYLSGHAPWSNGYEAIIFISGIGVLSGLLLYKNRNAFIPAAGALVAMIMMGFAHGGSMLDPQITPLEPVLKSYWLMVHVGIITSSYGFFGLSAILSIISLILYSIKPSKKTSCAIKELTIVNEMSLTIGVFALTIGTFLGGMWANESWGRYWSWDPKETWAFISVILYAVVLHLRLVPKLKSKLVFNIASLWAIWSIIFTYFGVNYYLIGLHSYAAGEPIPIPIWIYVTVVAMFIVSVVAYFRSKKIGIRL
ncbi:Putative cytochrome C-type biogenesis protein [Xanthomarina gelatinilytica]|uniref:Putative cytochrome C-type biogenesis protein n=1 Tax=Xanthomarina gelatinilytica TaxID=1137281 RepID=M7MGV9_9FLAO|nr:cytochrome c biogenesis protein CcsA [Xanthomarina gelatinilytica]EMQ95492.1 Putative cytochrome C-type biogenesis protein [Xanthomarina gelatinilytica]